MIILKNKFSSKEMYHKNGVLLILRNCATLSNFSMIPQLRDYLGFAHQIAGKAASPLAKVQAASKF